MYRDANGFDWGNTLTCEYYRQRDMECSSTFDVLAADGALDLLEDSLRSEFESEVRRLREFARQNLPWSDRLLDLLAPGFDRIRFDRIAEYLRTRVEEGKSEEGKPEVEETANAG